MSETQIPQDSFVYYSFLESSQKELLGRILTIVDATYIGERVDHYGNESLQFKCTKDLIKSAFRDKISEYHMMAKGAIPWPDPIVHIDEVPV
jgi:hypothetical protein